MKTDKPKLTRRSRRDTLAMPGILYAQHVVAVMGWPLGSIMTNKAAGQGWCDVVIELVEPIRLGGTYNTRRVRYDGRFYITYNGRNVYLGGALVFDVFDAVTHVYGDDIDEDREHNRVLKGY